MLDQGEIGYTTDSQRLYVGDAFTIGGIAVGIKYYTTTSGISAAIADDNNISTIQTGDIVFDTSPTTSRGLYILTGSNTFFDKTSAYSRLK